MSNVSNKNESEPWPSPYLQPYWYLSEACLVLLTIIAVYLFISVLKFGIAHKLKNGRDINSNKWGKWIYGMCILATFSTVLRMIADHVAAFISWKSTENCITTLTISTVMYALSLYPAYLFLWMRQSIFYASPVLSKILNKWITLLSWSTLFFILISGTTILVIHNIPQITGWKFEATIYGCMENSDALDTVPFVAAAVTVIFQVSLLALFLYPLVCRKTQKYRGGSHKASKDAPSSEANSAINPQSSSDCSKDYSEYKVGSQNTNGNAIMRTAAVDVDSSESGIDVSLPITGSGKDIHALGNHLSPDSNLPKGELYNESECNLDVSGNKCIANRGFTHAKIVHHRSQNNARASEYVSKQSPTSPTRDTSQLTTATKSVNKLSEDRKKSLRNRKKQGRRVIGYVRKSFILMLVCVFSDVFVNILQEVLEVPELVYLVIFDVNLIINDLCIIMSFREWKTIIFHRSKR